MIMKRGAGMILVTMMLEWFDRVGYSADIPGNAKTFGVHPTSLEEWAGRQNWG
jgi:hypothetical protein